jgi:cobyrinic acid a,c-diamide synthase
VILPRLAVAGLSGDSGKTLVSLGLILLARERGIPVAAFKKGPDYIDAAWLRWASGRAARNLDTYMMGFETARGSFVRHGLVGGLNLIEGNRGLYDGADAEGTHSTAALAKLLDAPVLLVVSPAKLTRTAAALVLGCQKLDPEVRIAGVILNRVSSSRQENLIRRAIEDCCGIPVVGVLPKASPAALLPGRHLGLVPPEEHPGVDDLRANLLGLVTGRLDFDRILEIASAAGPLGAVPDEPARAADGCGVRIGYFSDSAFTFYYPENLEALEAAGAALAPISSLTSPALPGGLDALYIGGGFPETHGAALSANRGLLGGLREAAAAGLPVFAECGGLMVLSEAICYRGRRYPMSGVLPFEVEVLAEPQGHGYAELLVDRPNPFFAEGLRLRGHEFHYSRIVLAGPAPPTACAVQRGTGCFSGRDAVIAGNVWAAYTHLHALATPEWAAGLVRVARKRRGRLAE